MPTINTDVYTILNSAVAESYGTSATPAINAGNFLDFGRASAGSGVDDVARAAIEAHAGNAEIHVTAAEKAAWDGKAEISDIPTSLPADGGNADTVDGKHANEFMQNLGVLATGSLLDYVLTMIVSGYLLVRGSVTDTPVSGQFFFVDVRRDASGSYAITATRLNAGGVWTNRYNVSTANWYGWANVADGGNAASVGAYTESKLSELESRIAALEAK